MVQRFKSVVFPLLGLAAGLLASSLWYPFSSAEHPTNHHQTAHSETGPQDEGLPVNPQQIPGPLGARIEFIESLDQASLDDLRSLDTELDRLVNYPEYYKRRRLLWMRWLELDPGDAIAHLKGKESYKPYDLSRLFRTWARLDAEAAFAGIDAHVEEESRAWNRRAALGELAETDADLFLKHLADLQPIDVDCGGVISELLGRGRDLALGVAAQLDGKSKANALKLIGKHWATEDPSAAMAWALEIEDQTARDGALVGIIEVWRHTDLAAASAQLKELSNRSGAQSIIREIATQLAENDPLEALAWANEHCEPSGFKDEALPLIAARVPVERIGEFVAELEKQGRGSLGNGIKYLTQGKSADELQQIIRMSYDHVGESPWNLLQRGAMQRWATLDVGAAIDFIGEQGEGVDKPTLYRALMPPDYRIDEDFDFALKIARTLPERYRTSALGDVASEAAKFDFSRAIAIADEISDSRRPYAYGKIADSWAQEIPSAAATWAESLPAGEERSTAFFRVANTWTGTESYAASEWIAGLEAGVDRDKAVYGMVRSLAFTDSDSAFHWAITVEDDDSRKRSLGEVAFYWSRNDPHGGLQAISASTELTEPERKKMIDRIHHQLQREAESENNK